MFKPIFFFAVLAATTAASAATLTQEVQDSTGMKKICIYSDGTTRTVSSMSFCPMSK